MQHFYFGYHNVKVLFKGWEINSIGGLLAIHTLHWTVLLVSIVGVFLFALLYEALKSLRIVLYHNREKILAKTKSYFNVQYNTLNSSVDITSERPEPVHTR